MRRKKLILAVLVLCLMTGTAMAQEPKVTTPMSKNLTDSSGKAAEAKVKELMSKKLVDIPSKEALMITVEYPPGSSDPIHRHNASAFVYVLEGSIVMQVKGGKLVTLGPGETFYEGPDDIHVVGRNASNTKPAKFVVFLIKDPGAPVLVPVQ